MTSRISAEMPPSTAGANGARGLTGEDATSLQLPEFVRAPFSAAMSQSMLLPAFIALFGIVAALFLVGITGSAISRRPQSEDDFEGYAEDGDDDDDYVECILRREPDLAHQPDAEVRPVYEEGDKQPVVARVRQPRPASAEAWRSDPVELGHSLLSDYTPQAEPIAFAHNGAHVDDEQRFRPMDDPAGYCRHSSG
jgi:hypothetical protein